MIDAPRDTDPHIRNPDVSKILRNLLDRETIQSLDDLRSAQSRYCHAYYGDEHGKTPPDSDEILSRESRRIRRYSLRQAIDWLYPATPPSTILECGSAGDASIAMEYPQSHVDSVDIDKGMFIFNLYDGLPRELFEAIGMKKHGVVGLGLRYPLQSDRINSVIKNGIPNLTAHVKDAKKMDFPTESADLALVQGTPDMLNFLPEMTRLIKPRRHIVSVVYDDHHQYPAHSAYAMNRYNGWPEFTFQSDERLRDLRLQRIQVPDSLRQLENLATYRNKRGKQFGAGVVFEVFQKK